MMGKKEEEGKLEYFFVGLVVSASWLEIVTLPVCGRWGSFGSARENDAITTHASSSYGWNDKNHRLKLYVISMSSRLSRAV